MKMLRFLALPVALIATLSIAKGDDITEEGYIKTWLLLAPIPLADGQSGTDGVDKEWIKDEAKLQPKNDDKIKVGDKELTWKKVTGKEEILDINDALGGQTENSVAYAVVYITAEAEMKKVKMKIGSDDQCRVYLNGAKVHTTTEARPLTKDEDNAEVELKKGVNTIVFKIVNEGGDFSGSLRFLDADDKPVKGLKVSVSPK